MFFKCYIQNQAPVGTVDRIEIYIIGKNMSVSKADVITSIEIMYEISFSLFCTYKTYFQMKLLEICQLNCKVTYDYQDFKEIYA